MCKNQETKCSFKSCWMQILTSFPFVLSWILCFLNMYVIALVISILTIALSIIFFMCNFKHKSLENNNLLTDDKTQIKFWKNNSIFVIFILVIIPLIINCTYLIGTPNGITNTKFEASDMLSFYGSFLAFLGTVALGILALWQNNKFKDENDKSQAKFEKINQKLLEIDITKERNKIFEMYFCYMEENQKIYDPDYVLQKVCQEYNMEEIFFRLKQAQLNAQKIKRRLMFIDKDGINHSFFKYCENQSDEAISIVQQTGKSTQQIVKELFEFWKNSSDDFNSKSLEFIYITNKRLLKEKETNE